jgi:integrase
MQRQRKQAGQIIMIGPRWYTRYYERVNVGGEIQRRRVTHLLGPVTTRGKTPPAEIVTECERHMATINLSTIPVAQIISLADFVENEFLPRAEKRLKRTTYRNYLGDWKRRLKPLVRRDHTLLKDFKTVHVQRWLDQIGQDELSRNSLKGIKSMISGLFKEAKRLGFFDGVNPAQDTTINANATPPALTYAYTLEEIWSLCARFPEPAATAFAVAAYAGLRRGEIEGLRWEDYRDGELHVTRSIVNGQTSTPKTAMSSAAVPVVRPLTERLEMHRLRNGNPEVGPIFRTSIVTKENPNGTPLSMHNLLNRTMLPALNRCVHCGLSEGLPHLKAKDCPGYERDQSIPAWKGFHAARRGLGSNLYRLGVHEKVIQKILRHSNVSTTMSYYVKSTALDVTDAMKQFEQNIADKLEVQNLQGSDGALKTGSSASGQLVN